jgi:hypothetical protein
MFLIAEYLFIYLSTYLYIIYFGSVSEIAENIQIQQFCL